MSLDDIRERVLLNSGGEERVEVNQRLLIDKILARYSSEFVVFRELMQNSDDARSSSVQIKFESANPSKDKNIIKDKITRILFKNNGFAFRDEDWNRLKRIAEGNPDEQKVIGAFGVGFYSLFSVCENPFVTSGRQGMAFYWRGDYLFAGQGPTDEVQEWTTFLMDMREPLELPNVEKFARFLANSLGFTGNLREISVYFNDTLMIHLSKEIQKPRLMSTTGFDAFSLRKLFHLTSVEVRNVQLVAKRLLVPTNIITDCQTKETPIFLGIVSGNLDVKLSESFSAEMERLTKKKPPNKTSVQMIFTGFDDLDNNLSGDHISRVFKDLFPHPEQGRIYIGFPTHQTTGCCSHFAARVIPTVERESIDLVDKTLGRYNKELLRIAGLLCRIVYEDEMNQIARIYNEMIGANIKNDDENIKCVREWLEKRAAHALTHFTFRQSTPNSRVGKTAELQFFNCSKKELSILSTKGVLPLSSVRIPNPEMEGFIKEIPVIPNTILEQCNEFLVKLEDIINVLSFQDVLCELKSRTLCEDELIKLSKWWIFYRSNGNEASPEEFEQFMKYATVCVGGKNRALNTFRYFLNPGIVPPDVCFLLEVFPYTISKHLQKKDLENWFGWSELSLVYWARFIVNELDLEVNPAFAEKVHYILERSIKNISQNDKDIIRRLFAKKKCIPTKFGMKIPSESYFQNVNLFPDLPTIQFLKPSSVQNIMQLLGVRKVVELQIIFDHLVKQGNCDHMQLVKYLASESDNLGKDEIMKLKTTPIWPKENLAELKPEFQRFVISDLYVPSSIHRELGLPLLDWRKRWIRNTLEGKFLIDLGLPEYPALQQILELAAPPTDPNVRSKALKYFIDNFNDKYSKDYDVENVNVAFLPCMDPSINAKPLECFIKPECSIMKFKAIRQDLRFQVEQFGVRHYPSNEELKNWLIENPPQDVDNAKKIFEYLASRQGDFDWKVISNLNFIPIQDKLQPDTIIRANPCSCFFAKAQEGSLDDYFTLIDFGQKANKFLQSCGVKNQPLPVDYAKLLVKSSSEIWNSINSIGDAKKYLMILNRIAAEYDYSIIYDLGLVVEMKKAPILVAAQIGKYCLASAEDIYINDDPEYQQIFKPLFAPEDDKLKYLYTALGSKSLRASVSENINPIGGEQETENSRKLQETIMDRAHLFYHECQKSEIRRDVEWLMKLKVREVQQIKATYTLKSKKETKTESKFVTACIKEKMKQSWILYITPNSEIIEISERLARNIYDANKRRDVIFLNMLLTTSLSKLANMFPIDCIPNLPNLRTVENYVMNNDIRQSTLTPGELQNTLQSAIDACRSNLGGINNQAMVQIVKENQPSYCDIIPGHLLYYVGTSQEVKIYVPINAVTSTNLFQTHSAQLNRFLNVLKRLAEVFQLASEVIHIFYDTNSSSVAFNSKGALFFNLKFFLESHDDECEIGNTGNAMTYWFLTFCHELAHNIIFVHNSIHEFYFSSFATIYMSSFQEMMNRYNVKYQ